MSVDISNSDLFKKIGMKENFMKKLLKNEAKSAMLRTVILESGVDYNSEINPRLGNVLINFGTHKKVENVDSEHRKIISSNILNGRIEKSNQTDAAIDFFLNLGEDGSFNNEEFERSSGIGISLTEEDIARFVGTFFEGIPRDEIIATTVMGVFNKGVKDEFPVLRWGDGRVVMKCIQNECLKKVGMSNMKELKALQKKMAKENNILLSIRFRARELEIAKNRPEIIDEHIRITGGKVITRFPPEPNGYLHIGHAKSMLFNFGYAEEKGGECNLRFDDTNPEKESQSFVDGIKEVVNWLGYKPARTVYSSDYFDDLYNFAVVLIGKGLAYMDFSKQAEIKNQRLNRLPSPFRNKFSIEENLRIFEGMKHGKYDEGEVCYRLKIDYQSDNANMRDFVGYRLKYVAHPRTGNKWCIYPTYEFTHCLSDSIEHITHSMCTMEFESKREPYYWLLHQLGQYKPFVWEFSRLNVTTSELSKRKINKLIETGKVRSFDDPRLLTIFGLRRRGYSPEVIRKFCAELGASRSTDTYVDIEKLEHTCRVVLDKVCLRKFCVIHPLRVVLTNMKEGEVRVVPGMNHPNKKELGQRELTISRVVYIERDDFRLVDDESYYGLAPNKLVGLRYGPNIKCEEVVYSKNDSTIVEELRCIADWEKSESTKGHIHWVAESKPGEEPFAVKTRFYKPLLKVDALEKGMELMDNLNENSEVEKSGCYLERGLVEEILKVKNKAEFRDMRFQFERVGFFVVDEDSDLEKNELVFNLIVTLKESKEKKSLKGGKKKKSKKKKRGGKK